MHVTYIGVGISLAGVALAYWPRPPLSLPPPDPERPITTPELIAYVQAALLVHRQHWMRHRVVTSLGALGLGVVVGGVLSSFGVPAT